MHPVHKAIRHAVKRAALHVIPHPDNDHVPHLLRGHYIIGGSVLALLVFLGVSWGIPQSQRLGLTAAVYSSVLVDLTNEARADEGLPVLRVNTTLEQAAALKAKDMNDQGYFAHTSPQGKSPWYWFAQAGYRFVYAGENLAVHFTETRDVQDALLASPTHRANILNAKFTELGIATYEGTYQGFPTTFVVEAFGTPQLAAAAPTAPTARPMPSPPTTTPKAVESSRVLGESAETQPVKAPRSAPVSITHPAEQSVKVVYQDTHLAVAEPTDVLTLTTQERPVPPVAGSTTPATPTSRWYQRFLMNPSPTTTAVLSIFGFLALFGTIAMLSHEVARTKTRHIAYGAGFTALIISLVVAGHLFAFPSLTII